MKGGRSVITRIQDMADGKSESHVGPRLQRISLQSIIRVLGRPQKMTVCLRKVILAAIPRA